jgi:hypothetical protein
VVYKPVSAKVGLLLVFIAVVHLILPVILSFILRNYALRTYSLLGFFYAVLVFKSDPIVIHQSYILLVNVGLCIVPAMLIWIRYKNILTARSKM